MGAGLSARSYQDANRLIDDQRLILEETYFEAGVRVRLEANTAFSLMGGWSGNRKVYRARQVFLPEGPAQTIDPDFYGGVRMEFDL